MGYTAPRAVYRAFSLVFRVPDIRRQFGEVRKLIYLCYTAALALRALQIIIKGDPSLTTILILVGTLMSMGVIGVGLMVSSPYPTQHEEHSSRSPY